MVLGVLPGLLDPVAEIEQFQFFFKLTSGVGFHESRGFIFQISNALVV